MAGGDLELQNGLAHIDQGRYNTVNTELRLDALLNHTAMDAASQSIMTLEVQGHGPIFNNEWNIGVDMGIQRQMNDGDSGGQTKFNIRSSGG